jgi:hypothetical protein
LSLSMTSREMVGRIRGIVLCSSLVREDGVDTRCRST